MPVVSLSYDRLLQLVSGGRKITKNVIAERLPYLGLDIESDDGKDVRIEYSPNRPDYATDLGVSLALQGLLGVKRGLVPLDVEGGKKPDTQLDGSHPTKYAIATRRAVSAIRPVLTGIVARGKRLGGNPDDGGQMLRQLIGLQEDLHFGLGRNRKKVAIGMHDLAKISFPLEYTTIPADYTFVPLHEKKTMRVSEIIKETKAGRAYGDLVKDATRFPAILDSDGNVVSLPPIINSAMTSVTPDTADVLVDVTGTSRHAAEGALAVIAVTLRAAGFRLQPVHITGGKNRTPHLGPRKVSVSVETVNEMLGLDLSLSDAASCLAKCRLQPIYDGDAASRSGIISCMVPSYRQDVISGVDLVEEVALGYGTWRLKPVLLPPRTFGSYGSQADNITRHVDAAMTGMEYVEALNPCLTGVRLQYEMAGRKAPSKNRMIGAADSKSSEHAILRDSLLPGLMYNLSKNIHEAYPQRLYETGTVFAKSMARRGDMTGAVREAVNAAAVSAHAGSDFSEAKSALQYALAASGCGISGVRTDSASHHMFARGRCAKVVASLAGGRRVIGHVGEVSDEILSSYRIRVPVAGFEVSLSNIS